MVSPSQPAGHDVDDRREAAAADDDTVRIVRYEASTPRPTEDALAAEEPLEIRVRGHAVSVTMRTPGHDEELAAGFLLAEGLLRGPADVLRIETCPRNEEGNLINVVLAPDVPFDLARLTRHVFASSSCGLCGKATIDAVQSTFPPLRPPSPGRGEMCVTSSTLYRLPAVMRAAQDTFSRTGGLHAAALFTADGDLVCLREDVGRHNAVDKVLGHALLGGSLPLDRHVLLVSGRSSFEIMQKALAGRVPVVAAVSAPSSLAVRFARDANQTLVGFLRDARMNVYTRADRVVP
jgi:FdhD protein